MSDSIPLSKISVSLPAHLVERIDERAAEMQRSRSNAIAVLLEQALIPYAIGVGTYADPDATLTYENGPIPTVRLDPGYMETPKSPDPAPIGSDECPKGGKHTPKLAKSGSGVIGCPKCQMIKRNDGSWA